MALTMGRRANILRGLRTEMANDGNRDILLDDIVHLINTYEAQILNSRVVIDEVEAGMHIREVVDALAVSSRAIEDVLFRSWNARDVESVDAVYSVVVPLAKLIEKLE